MKYAYGFGLQVPFVNTKEDGSTEHCYALLSTNDPVDRRKIKQLLRKWVKKALGRSLHPSEQRLLLKRVVKHSQPVVYMRAPSRPIVDDEDDESSDPMVNGLTIEQRAADARAKGVREDDIGDYLVLEEEHLKANNAAQTDAA